MFRIIDSITGRAGNKCYYILALAVMEMRNHYPRWPPVMSTVYPAVAKQIGSNVDAISKAVARAVTDIWEHGDREMLERIVGRKLMEKPSPKDLLVLLTYLFTTS